MRTLRRRPTPRPPVRSAQHVVGNPEEIPDEPLTQSAVIINKWTRRVLLVGDLSEDPVII